MRDESHELSRQHAPGRAPPGADPRVSIEERQAGCLRSGCEHKRSEHHVFKRRVERRTAIAGHFDDLCRVAMTGRSRH